MSYSFSKDVNREDCVIAKVFGGKLDGYYLTIRPEGAGSKHFVLADGELLPVLSKNAINSVMITGAKRSGKTTLMCKMINQIPNVPVFWLSRHQSGDDPSVDIDEDRMERIDIDQILDNPIDHRDLPGIVVADDADNGPNRSINMAVNNLIDRCMEVGRRDCRAVIRTNHHIFNYQQTRQALLECDAVIMFYQGGLKGQMRRYLKEKGGLDKKQIDTLMLSRERWLCHYCLCPPCFFTSKEFWMF